MVINGFNLNERIAELAAKAPDTWRLDGCGVTRSERPIPALLHGDAYVPETHRTRVLLIGGLSGKVEDVELALKVIESFIDGGEALSREIALSAIPCGNPDGLALGANQSNGAGGNPATGYPPSDENFYGDSHNPESRYIWRWASFQAPDMVMEVRDGGYPLVQGTLACGFPTLQPQMRLVLRRGQFGHVWLIIYQHGVVLSLFSCLEWSLCRHRGDLRLRGGLQRHRLDGRIGGYPQIELQET